MKRVKIPFIRRWYDCPHCGAHLLIYDDTAECIGVFFKCKNCKEEIEIRVKEGKQEKH